MSDHKEKHDSEDIEFDERFMIPASGWRAIYRTYNNEVFAKPVITFVLVKPTDDCPAMVVPMVAQLGGFGHIVPAEVAMPSDDDTIVFVGVAGPNETPEDILNENKKYGESQDDAE